MGTGHGGPAAQAYDAAGAYAYVTRIHLSPPSSTPMTSKLGLYSESEHALLALGSLGCRSGNSERAPSISGLIIFVLFLATESQMKGSLFCSFVGDTSLSLCIPDISSSLEQQWNIYPKAKVTSCMLETPSGI